MHVFVWVSEYLSEGMRLAESMRVCANTVVVQVPIVGVRPCVSACCMCMFSVLPQ